MKRVIAINGSPNMQKGATERLLVPFLEGMSSGGYEVETLYPKRLNIHPCDCGTMYCWYKKPGECCFKDDMQSVYATLREADIVVFASPVYIPLPGEMQNFINRLSPLIEPRLEFENGQTRGRQRDGYKMSQIVAMVTGGWWELSNTDTVVRIISELARDLAVEFAGAVLRPHALIMTSKGVLTPDGQAVLDASRQAGFELASEGFMHPETLERVSRPLIPEPVLRRIYNSML